MAPGPRTRESRDPSLREASNKRERDEGIGETIGLRKQRYRACSDRVASKRLRFNLQDKIQWNQHTTKHRDGKNGKLTIEEESCPCVRDEFDRVPAREQVCT